VGGSIGVHYSTANYTTNDSSVTTIINSHFKNQSQNPVHFEDCRRIFLYNCNVEKDLNTAYDWDFQISNETWAASIKKCSFRNIHVNFNQASNLKLAIIDSCNFVSEYTSASTALPTFIEGRPTICINSTFDGKARLQQAALMNTRNCTFKNFGALAIYQGYATDHCTFANGSTPISTVDGGFANQCTFTNVSKTDYNLPKNNDWTKVFGSVINIVDGQNKSLGQINCN
jgi:hypothetical protein